MPPPSLQIDTEYAEKYRWPALITVMLGLFMAVLDGNIVNVALPRMMAAFSTNSDVIRWIVESYAISYAVFTMTTGWLREKTGIKATYLLGLTIFTAASMLCGIAWNTESMIFFRILQGLGGGIMTPSGFTVITELFPPRQRGAAFGIFGIVIVIAPTVGPTLGGYLVDSINWRYIFYINLPFGLLTFLLTMINIREFRPLNPRPFDFAGFIGIAVCLGCLLTALTEGQREGWTSGFIMLMYTLSLAGFVGFVVAEFIAKHPLMDITVFSNFHFCIISVLNVLRSVSMFGRMFILPLFFQNLVGYSAMTTGWILAPGALASGIVMPIAGRLVDKIGPNIFLFGGFAVFGASTLMLYNLDTSTSSAAILIPLIISGIGMGALNTPLNATAMNVVKPSQIGEVSMVLTVLMQVGGAFGVAFLGTYSNDRAAFHQSVFAERITQYGSATQSALQSLAQLGQRIGESHGLAELQAPAILSSQVMKRATIAGYQDALIVSGLICLVALIPALGLLTLKRTSPKPGGRHPGGE